MLNAIASLCAKWRRRPASAGVAAPVPLASSTVAGNCGDIPAGMVWADVLPSEKAATLAPGTLYVDAASGAIRRAPQRFSAAMEPDAFAAAFDRWLSDLAPDVSASWERPSFAALVDWFASENAVASISIEDLVETGRFIEDDAGNFAAVPGVWDDGDDEETLSPTAERMLPLLATAGKPMTVKSIAKALNCNSAPVSRAIRRSLRNLVNAERHGREVFVSLRDSGSGAERAAA